MSLREGAGVVDEGAACAGTSDFWVDVKVAEIPAHAAAEGAVHELVLRQTDDLAVGVLSDGAPEIVLAVENPAPDCVETAFGDVGF